MSEVPLGVLIGMVCSAGADSFTCVAALSLLSGARDAAGGAGGWRDAEFPARPSSVDGGD